MFLWKALTSLLLVLSEPSLATALTSPRHQQQQRHQSRRLQVNTSTDNTVSPESQRIEACEAAHDGEPFETGQSVSTRFDYELVTDKNPLLVGYAIENVISDYLTSTIVLTNCGAQSVSALTGSVLAIRAGGSNLVSSGNCTKIMRQQQPANATLTTESSKLTCYQIVGSNTVYLEDSHPDAVIDVPTLEQALEEYVASAFASWIIQMGPEQGVYAISHVEEGFTRQSSTSPDNQTIEDPMNGYGGYNLDDWENAQELGGFDGPMPNLNGQMNDGFGSVAVVAKVIFFSALFLVAALIFALLRRSSSRNECKDQAHRMMRDQIAMTVMAGEATSDSDGDDEIYLRHSVAMAEKSCPFAPREGHELVWSNVNMTLAGRGDKPERKLLENVWGEVPPKRTTAIMGPSGAGKTSLLNILAGRASTRGRLTIESDIRLNNFAVDPTSMEVRKMIAFVAQDDSLEITATPREAIRFSAKLRLPRSITDSDLDKLTTQTLSELGLTSCADTIVGGPLLKGISGGERKRTSVGVELVVRPKMVFLDEPTSGLDSFSAVQVCQVLKKVAHAGASVLFTIHQPSSEIFSSFDTLILLNRGRVMYQGSCLDVCDFFVQKGFPCPSKFNPADFIMNVAQENKNEELEEMGFFSADERRLGEAVQVESNHNLRKILSNDKISNVSPIQTISTESKFHGVSTQVRMLFSREMTNIQRNRSVLVPRTIMVAVISTMIGIIFFNVGETNPADTVNLQSRFGSIIILVTLSLMSTAQSTLLTFPEERPVFIREYSTNHYSVLSYFCSRLLVEAMLTAIQIFILVFVSYYMVGYQRSVIYFFSSCYALAMTSTALAATIGAAMGGNAELSVQFMPILFAPQLLFTGYFVAPHLIPVWLRWLQYVFPATYAVRLLVAYEFDQCSDELVALLNCNQLMLSVNVSIDDAWWYWLILGCQFIVFRTLALAILRANACRFY